MGAVGEEVHTEARSVDWVGLGEDPPLEVGLPSFFVHNGQAGHNHHLGSDCILLVGLHTQMDGLQARLAGAVAC